MSVFRRLVALAWYNPRPLLGSSREFLMQAQSLRYHNEEDTEVRAAKKVIARHQVSAPVDVMAIAQDMGIKVYQTELGQNISGVLRRDEKYAGPSGYLILVNSIHPLNRMRFT